MITGVILAHNEERNIVSCIEHLRPHVAEILLIDTESTDGTVELARTLVDRVLSHPNEPNFDCIRNIAIPEARYEWLWFVDADERVSARTGEAVRNLLNKHGDEFEAITIPFKSYFCGQWMRHCGWWPGYTMPRVLKRGAFEFVKRLHGGVNVTGRQIRLAPDPEIGVDHFSYETVEHYVEKLNRYTSSEAGQLAEVGAKWDWRAALREMVRDLWMYYEYNPGHLDGERGWILAWLSGQYRWLARAKLIDVSPSVPDTPPPFGGTEPADLDEFLTLFQCELSALRASRPQLPLGIHWRSPVFDPSGYADEARAFVKGLASGERPFSVEEIPWSDATCVLPAADARLLRAATRAVRPRHVATITECIPTLVEPDPFAAINILRTVFETDRIPDSWHPHLGRFDEIWVPSWQNYRAFRRSGVAPEKLRVVPSCYDEEVFRVEGPRLPLPSELTGRFVFLSVFDWQLRKGWDVLLRAYCQEFSPLEQVGLLLKVTRSHGHTLALIRGQADQVLSEVGESLVHRPDIVLTDDKLSAEEMASLYRAASAFVLPSRGEGWGRPYMEALACGLPTIATRHLGSADFLNDDNSLLVDASLVQVPEVAANEIPPYRGHRWYEPDLVGLRRAMRHVYRDSECHRVANSVAAELPSRYGLSKGRDAVCDALRESERRFQIPDLPRPTSTQINVTLEGEFFALHSFSNINEQLALHFSQDERLALSLHRVKYQPAYDDAVPYARRLSHYFSRPLGDERRVTIRHAFPPNWSPVERGLWIHIQPWEFGHLPEDWIKPIRDEVNEVWAPSHYVKLVYERSGIPAEKIRVIPWGIDPDVFAPDIEPRWLPTDKSFRFLYVGGLIRRKGFDTLLAAYLAEFSADEDACLVVKDQGSQTFYKYDNYQNELLSARDNPTQPAIVYFEDLMSAGQLASLYTACNCFVAPFRGEGFGLPILEAMACGLAVIIPQGGPADDFTSPETAYLLPSTEVPTEHDSKLAGPALELSVSINDVRRAMRQAYEDRDRTRRLGQVASRMVREKFTWQRTADAMATRLVELESESPSSAVVESVSTQNTSQGESTCPRLTACMIAREAERKISRALAQLMPFVDEVVVVIAGMPDRTEAIAKEYGAKSVVLSESNDDGERNAARALVTTDWLFWVDPRDQLRDLESANIHELLSRLPPAVSEVHVDMPESRFFDSPDQSGGALKICRNHVVEESAAPDSMFANAGG